MPGAAGSCLLLRLCCSVLMLERLSHTGTGGTDQNLMPPRVEEQRKEQLGNERSREGEELGNERRGKEKIKSHGKQRND